MQILRIGSCALSPSREEAAWLRDLFQNPLYDDETRTECIMRNQWFESIKQFLENIEPPKHPPCTTCFRNQPGYVEDDIPF